MGNKCSIGTETAPFQCTGYQGQHRWRILHETVAEIECDTCRDHAVKLMSGLHDHVNSGLGEEIYDHANYRSFVKEVNHVFESCVAKGKCRPL